MGYHNKVERFLNFKLIGQKHIINLNLHNAKSFFPFDHQTASIISSVKRKDKAINKDVERDKAC